MPAPLDLTNQRFGRLVALSFARMQGPHRAWLCQCDCGNRVVVRASALATGGTLSCGCYNKDVHRQICLDRATHGLSKTRTYTVWVNMLQRCKNKKSGGFHKYGAKGIKVCKRWNGFENFLFDMGKCPSPRHTLDRIDNSKGYEPDNCRWATMKAQQNNRTNNRHLTLGHRTQTLQQWSEELGVDRKTISNRIDLLGWSIERALATPVRNRR